MAVAWWRQRGDGASKDFRGRDFMYAQGVREPMVGGRGHARAQGSSQYDCCCRLADIVRACSDENP